MTLKIIIYYSSVSVLVSTQSHSYLSGVIAEHAGISIPSDGGPSGADLSTPGCQQRR